MCDHECDHPRVEFDRQEGFIECPDCGEKFSMNIEDINSDNHLEISSLHNEDCEDYLKRCPNCGLKLLFSGPDQEVFCTNGCQVRFVFCYYCHHHYFYCKDDPYDVRCPSCGNLHKHDSEHWDNTFCPSC